MSGHRQAAVALHALTDQDRDQILAQLPDADQAALRDHLAELHALGFQRDGLDLGLARAAGRARVRAELASAAPAQLFTLLEHEPAALVAQVLALQDWHWRADLLALFSPTRRELIKAAAGMAPAPARARFLREALSDKLGALTPVAAIAPTPLTALRRWVRSWRR